MKDKSSYPKCVTCGDPTQCKKSKDYIKNLYCLDCFHKYTPDSNRTKHARYNRADDWLEQRHDFKSNPNDSY